MPNRSKGSPHRGKFFRQLNVPYKLYFAWIMLQFVISTSGTNRTARLIYVVSSPWWVKKISLRVFIRLSYQTSHAGSLWWTYINICTPVRGANSMTSLGSHLLLYLGCLKDSPPWEDPFELSGTKLHYTRLIRIPLVILNPPMYGIVDPII